MNYYPLAKSEIDSIGSLNMQTTIFLTVGASLISLGAGIVINYIFVEKATPESNILTKFGVPILALLGIVFLGLCWATRKKRNGIWETIIDQSSPSNAASGTVTPLSPKA
jgi:hypothetical protein